MGTRELLLRNFLTVEQLSLAQKQPNLVEPRCLSFGHDVRMETRRSGALEAAGVRLRHRLEEVVPRRGGYQAALEVWRLWLDVLSKEGETVNIRFSADGRKSEYRLQRL